jgi:hypothetical protein
MTDREAERAVLQMHLVVTAPDDDLAPVETPWGSRDSHLDGPAGLQLTLFEELDPPV